MARKTFKEGFKEEAIAYCKKNSEKTIKDCAADLDIGYSTLRRWLSEAEDKSKADSSEKKPENQKPAVAEKDVAEAPSMEKEASVDDDVSEQPQPEEVSETKEKDQEKQKEDQSEIDTAVDDLFAEVAVAVDKAISPSPKEDREVAKEDEKDSKDTNIISDKLELVGLYKKRFGLSFERYKIKRKMKKNKK